MLDIRHEIKPRHCNEVSTNNLRRTFFESTGSTSQFQCSSGPKMRNQLLIPFVVQNTEGWLALPHLAMASQNLL